MLHEKLLRAHRLKTAYHQSLSQKGAASILYMGGYRCGFQNQKNKFVRDLCDRLKLPLTALIFRSPTSAVREMPLHVDAERRFQKWLTQATDILDKVTYGPQILAAYSMGCYVGLALAARRQGKLKP